MDECHKEDGDLHLISSRVRVFCSGG